MKLSFHQHIALFWMIGAPGVFAPVIENAKRPDAGAVMAWGVAIVAVMITLAAVTLMDTNEGSTPALAAIEVWRAEVSE